VPSAAKTSTKKKPGPASPWLEVREEATVPERMEAAKNYVEAKRLATEVKILQKPQLGNTVHYIELR